MTTTIQIEQARELQEALGALCGAEAQLLSATDEEMGQAAAAYLAARERHDAAHTKLIGRTP